MFSELEIYKKDGMKNGFKEDGTSYKVMIVDDALSFRRLLKRLLEDVGYEVIGEFSDGSVAVAKYAQIKPDIVTMDISMPEMEGSVAIDAIRRNHQDAKIIMVTSLGTKSLVKECLELGAKGYILKPITNKQIPKMLEIIKQVAAED